MTIDMRYQVKLTPDPVSKDGTSTMRLEPSNIESDWDITGPGGRIVLSLRGSDMEGTQNGNVIIDTKKSIGSDQAKQFKKEILPLYLTGQMDMDVSGKVKQFQGDAPFVEFWVAACVKVAEFATCNAV